MKKKFRKGLFYKCSVYYKRVNSFTVQLKVVRTGTEPPEGYKYFSNSITNKREITENQLFWLKIINYSSGNKFSKVQIQ